MTKGQFSSFSSYDYLIGYRVNIMMKENFSEDISIYLLIFSSKISRRLKIFGVECLHEAEREE